MEVQPTLPERPVEPPNINLATGKPVDAAEPVSPRLSFKGWALGVWLAKNKGAVKLLVVLFLAWLTSLFAAVEPPELKALLVGAVGFASKFGLDLLDYWLTPQPEPPGRAG